jgi:hypothetical protein
MLLRLPLELATNATYTSRCLSSLNPAEIPVHHLGLSYALSILYCTLCHSTRPVSQDNRPLASPGVCQVTCDTPCFRSSHTVHKNDTGHYSIYSNYTPQPNLASAPVSLTISPLSIFLFISISLFCAITFAFIAIYRDRTASTPDS